MTATETTFQWQRTLKTDDYFPLCQIGYIAAPKYPHDSEAFDRELLESHYGCDVQTIESWHWYGRRFAMTDGTRGILDGRWHSLEVGTTHAKGRH